MSLITSRSNPKVKLIRGLQARRRRDRTRLFLIEGLRLVEEARSVGVPIEQLVVAPQVIGGAVWSRLQRVQAPFLEVTPEVLASISPRHAQDGVVAVARQRFARLDDVRLRGDECFVAMNRVTEPWSIGNIMRTCDAVGAQGIILLGDATDPYYPAAVRASLGAVFSQLVVKANFEELAHWKRQQGCLLVGTSPGGLVDYREADYRGPLVVMTGGERVGLTLEEQALCDLMVRIPMVGRCESHHVAVATGLVLYEMLRQRTAPMARGSVCRNGKLGMESIAEATRSGKQD